jgi:hypothetical protein
MMKTKPNFWAVGVFLGALGAPWGQPIAFTQTTTAQPLEQTTAPRRDWRTVATSADFKKLVAAPVQFSGGFVAIPAPIYTSSDSGATWTQTDAPAQASWQAIACSANGSNIVLAGYSICTLRTPFPPPPLPPSPPLHIARSGAGLGLSWRVPSTGFALQQNSDLTTTNWTDVPTTPALNFTNLNYQLTAPFSPGSHFYRLKQR